MLHGIGHENLAAMTLIHGYIEPVEFSIRWHVLMDITTGPSRAPTH